MSIFSTFSLLPYEVETVNLRRQKSLASNTEKHKTQSRDMWQNSQILYSLIQIKVEKPEMTNKKLRHVSSPHPFNPTRP
jgi:hypothetical protein